MPLASPGQAISGRDTSTGTAASPSHWQTPHMSLVPQPLRSPVFPAQGPGHACHAAQKFRDRLDRVTSWRRQAISPHASPLKCRPSDTGIGLVEKGGLLPHILAGKAVEDHRNQGNGGETTLVRAMLDSAGLESCSSLKRQQFLPPSPPLPALNPHRGSPKTWLSVNTLRRSPARIRGRARQLPCSDGFRPPSSRGCNLADSIRWISPSRLEK